MRQESDFFGGRGRGNRECDGLAGLGLALAMYICMTGYDFDSCRAGDLLSFWFSTLLLLPSYLSPPWGLGGSVAWHGSTDPGNLSQ